MTIEEHRDDARYLAETIARNPAHRLQHDVEATELIAFALEEHNQELLDAVETRVENWLEGEDQKDTRTYLIHAVRTLLQQTERTTATPNFP